MKKIGLLLICFSLTFSIFATEKKGGFEASTYATNQYSLGELSKISLGNLGGGLAFGYNLPSLPKLGFSGRADFAGVFSKQERLSSWLSMMFAGGVYLNLDLNQYVSIRPEVSYGALLNLLLKNSEPLFYADQVIQFAIALRFTTKDLIEKGLIFEISPIYSLFPENTNLGHYLGFRTGISYKF